MRMFWLVLVPVVLGAGSTGYAQEARASKAKSRGGSIWAVAHEEAAPARAQPLAQPLAQPVTIPAPVDHAPPAESHGDCPGKCGKCAKLCEKCHALFAWACYRRSRSCCKNCDSSCCYHCHPPLYLYFLGHCREGASWATAPPGPPCSSCGGPCCWGKLPSPGHAMFATPTGSGVCGIR